MMSGLYQRGKNCLKSSEGWLHVGHINNEGDRILLFRPQKNYGETSYFKTANGQINQVTWGGRYTNKRLLTIKKLKGGNELGRSRIIHVGAVQKWKAAKTQKIGLWKLKRGRDFDNVRQGWISPRFVVAWIWADHLLDTRGQVQFIVKKSLEHNLGTKDVSQILEPRQISVPHRRRTATKGNATRAKWADFFPA